jgi:hypothetical protein
MNKVLKDVYFISFIILLPKPVYAEQFFEGEQIIVETSHPSPPYWTVTPPADTDEYFYSVGVKTSAPTLDGGETDARMDGVKKFIERFYGIKVSTEYKKVRRSFESEITEKVRGSSGGQIAGIKLREVYWKKYKIYSEGRFNYYFDIWVLLEIRRTDIERILKGLIMKRKEAIGSAEKTLAEIDNWVMKNPEEAISLLNSCASSLKEYEGESETKVLLERINSKKREIKDILRSVVIQIDEKNFGKDTQGVIREKVASLLNMNGFIVKNYNGRLNYNNKEQLKRAGFKNGFSFILLGDVNTQKSDRFGKVVFARAVGELKMLNLFTDEVLFTVSINEKGVGADYERAGFDALRKSAESISESIQSQIMTISR